MCAWRGSPVTHGQTFRDLLAYMCHGARIAMLDIPEREMAIDWNLVVVLQSDLDIRPIIAQRFHYTELRKGFEVMITGQSRKVVLDWSV